MAKKPTIKTSPKADDYEAKMKAIRAEVAASAKAK